MVLNANFFCLALLAVTTPVLGQLPYNPTRLILSPDQSKVYQFSVRPSQASLSYFDLSKQISSSSQPIAIDQALPFQTSQEAFLPIVDNEGITVLSGDCQDTSKEGSLWRLVYNKDGKNGTWSEVKLDTTDTPLVANYLSAGFSSPANTSGSDASLYTFGGMCPSGPSNATNWTSAATYSNTMFLMSSSNDQSPYKLSITGTRAPPIAEAGLTITPLSAIATKSTSGQSSQQQNFVLLGGHTQTAFINMSQVAIFSLPEASWSIVGITQLAGTVGDLARRSSDGVEPRSGHTAVLTEDGTKIVVFGGWVGDVTNPATPQLAVLELGSGYGGTTAWQWTAPQQTNNPITSAQGLYGHGAVMLPGNIMMVSGGSSIGPSKRKRDAQSLLFYNIDTETWSTMYKHATPSESSGLDSSQRAGLGAGLGLGLSAVVASLLVWWLYSRRMREKRAERERHLRELAFGSERYQSSSRIPSRLDNRFGGSEMRSASWGSRQEQQIGTAGFSFPWTGQQRQEEAVQEVHDGSAAAERTGLEIPSPTRGLRKSLSTRGPASYGNNFVSPITGSGSVFRIDEAEEESSVRSLRVNESRMSDPFKDPPHLEATSAAEERKREVQGWVEGWQSAAASMNLSRNPSQVRTYSNISQAHSHSGSSSYRTGRESPDKSDRTGSNLSDRSGYSIQRSTGTLSRQISQRSVSAGYTLFAGAAAAMRGFTNTNRESLPARAASKRSVSCHTGMPQRSASSSQQPFKCESRALLRGHSPTKSVSDEPEIKDYKNSARTSSLTSQRKKMDILGSFKRVLTGTSHVDVQAQVDHYEEKSEEAHPLPPPPDPEMSEAANTTSAFWRGKKGARDWIDDDTTDHPTACAMTSAAATTTNRKRRSTIDAASSVGDYDGEDWDVETAVQQRVVQVMFTVPKEKLRVVNADTLSLVSRSDVDEREDRDRRTDLRRMDSVKEDGDDEEHNRATKR